MQNTLSGDPMYYPQSKSCEHVEFRIWNFEFRISSPQVETLNTETRELRPLRLCSGRAERELNFEFGKAED